MTVAQQLNAASIARRRIGMVLIALVALLLLGSGAAKLAGPPQIVQHLEHFGFTSFKVLEEGGIPTIPLVALLELLSATLLLLPRTRSLGVLVTSAFLGGAIATHVQHNEPLAGLPAAVILCVAWTGVWLKHPVALWSF